MEGGTAARVGLFQCVAKIGELPTVLFESWRCWQDREARRRENEVNLWPNELRTRTSRFVGGLRKSAMRQEDTHGGMPARGRLDELPQVD